MRVSHDLKWFMFKFDHLAFCCISISHERTNKSWFLSSDGLWLFFVDFVLRRSWISIVYSILVASFLRGFVYLSAYSYLFILRHDCKKMSDIFLYWPGLGSVSCFPLVFIEWQTFSISCVIRWFLLSVIFLKISIQWSSM